MSDFELFRSDCITVCHDDLVTGGEEGDGLLQILVDAGQLDPHLRRLTPAQGNCCGVECWIHTVARAIVS